MKYFSDIKFPPLPPWEVIVSIIVFSMIMGLIAYLLLKKNEKRAKKMKLNIGEIINFSTMRGNTKGKVIEDGKSVKIEVIVPRHSVYKFKK